MSKKQIAKILLALGIGVATVASGAAVVGCGDNSGTGGGQQQEQPKTEYTVNFDLNGGNGTAPAAQKVESGEKLAKVTDPTHPEGFEFDGWWTAKEGGKKWNFETDTVTAGMTLYARWKSGKTPDGEEITSISAEKTTKTYTLTNGSATIAVDDVTVTGGGKALGSEWTISYALEKDGSAIGGEAPWTVTEAGAYVLKVSATKSGLETPLTTTLDITVKSESTGEDTKLAVFELIPDELEAKTYADGYNVGIFTILPGTTIRNRARLNYDVYGQEGATKDTAELLETDFSADKSIQYNGEKRGFSLKAPAPGKLSLYLDNGSSGLTEEQFQSIMLTKPNGETETIYYPSKLLRKIVLDLDEAGEYSITRGKADGVGTTDIYYARFEAEVSVTPVESMKIANPGDTEFFVGQELDTSKLQVQLTYESGMVEPVALNDPRLKIDTSAYNKDVAGTYTITVTFTDDEGNVFTDSYDVTVYDVKSIELGYNKIVTGNNGYNGTYENLAVRQFYFVNESIQLDGMSVYVVLANGTKMMVNTGFTNNISSIDMSKPGKKEVIISWGNSATIVEKFDIYVAAKVEISGDKIETKVDANVADDQIGTAANGVYQFKTIQQSLEFLGALDLGENVKKVINLAEGRYYEKVEVKIPNVTIKGASSDATKTVIEYDALYGEKDESGFEHTTDSTATLNVRKDAVGFVIENVTISNAWNSTSYFDEHKGEKYGEHRALAALFQADKVVVDNCRMLGYQDTVEFFTGRQYVLNTYIQGRTDFIFGTNNTTYFYNCQIHSIESDGYITAFKGNNKGGDDVLYGAIFDKCTFTAADNVAAGSTAIGRPWGAYAAVAVINSNLGGHISTAASTGASAKERYVAMSGNLPYDANVKFVEYNNTGAGAISEEVKGMKMLSAAEAAKYSDLSVIFDKTNGGVKYSSAWDGGKGTEITEKTYKFSDYYKADDEYNSSNHVAENEAMFGGDATVNGKWNHELNQNKDQAKFQEGTVIKFNIVGEVSVTTYGSPYGAPENVKISYKDGCATITIVATEKEPIKNGCYITAITIDTSKTPADGDVEEPAPAGKIVYKESCEILMGDIQSTIQSSTGWHKGVYIDATTGKVGPNGDNVWAQFNTGTVLTVYFTPGANVEVTVKTYSADVADIVVNKAEGFATITSQKNDYIGTITLTFNTSGSETPGDKVNDVTLKIEALENLDEIVASTASADSTEAFELYNDGHTVLTVASGIKINSNNYTFTDGVKFGYRLQLRGSGSAAKRSVKLELAKGAEIKVYVRAAGDGERQFGFYDSGYNVITQSPATTSQDGNIYTYTAESAGTYYLGGTDGFNVYAIVITYKATGGEDNPNPDTSEKYQLVVPAKGEWSADTVMDDGFFTILATSGKKNKIESLKENNTSYTKNGKNLTFGSQYSLTSGGVYGNKVWQAGFKFTATETCKVTVYVAAKSDKDVKLAVYNYVELPDDQGTVTPSAAAVSNIYMDGEAVSEFDLLTKDASSNTVVEYVFELPAGTYALGGSTGGLYLYGMIVEVGI